MFDLRLPLCIFFLITPLGPLIWCWRQTISNTFIARPLDSICWAIWDQILFALKPFFPLRACPGIAGNRLRAQQSELSQGRFEKTIAQACSQFKNRASVKWTPNLQKLLSNHDKSFFVAALRWDGSLDGQHMTTFSSFWNSDCQLKRGRWMSWFWIKHVGRF